MSTYNTPVTPAANPLAFRGLSVLGLVSEYGPNLWQVNTAMTLSELHQFLDYHVESEISPKAEGRIADILRSVQRPASKDRQARIGAYQENYLLKPKPLDEAIEQGYMPAITLLANRPLRMNAVPGATSQMGQALMLVEKEDEENTIVIPSDGVGRITGLENREKLYSAINADSETRRLRTLLNRLRIPTLILFPKEGYELSELHMQQALYDMNVLATPLQSTMALNRDNRSPYNAVVKMMFADATANLRQFDLQKDMASMIRFVKIALEGPKAAEKAGATGTSDAAIDTKAASTNLTYFWSVLTSSMARDTLKDKDNMATGAPGITGLAIVAHELFFGRGSHWSPVEKANAIRKLGAIDWSRSKLDANGKAVLNPVWDELGLLILKPDRKGNLRAVMGGAGANNSRIMTAHLLKIAGLEKPIDSEALALSPAELAIV